MASLALREREAVESDGHARSTCGVRELRDAPVRRSVRQRAAAARRPTSIVCWWQSGDAGGAANRRRAPACATSVATREPPRGSAATNTTLAATTAPSARQRGDQHALAATVARAHGDIRAGPLRSSGRPTRHTHSPPHGDIGVVLGWWLLTALGFARAPNRARRLTALNDQQKRGGVYLYGANSSRARARARRWRRELGGGVRQHPGSNNCVEGAYGIARFARARGRGER